MYKTLKIKSGEVIAMGDAKMKWDDDLKRWRRMYRGKRLIRYATQLGGTNATDTKVAANQWFEQEKARLDVELGEKTRPHESEYRATLESLQMTEEQLRSFRQDPRVLPVIDSVKRKKQEIERRLKGRSLPEPDDFLRNPIDISVRNIEEEAKRRATEVFLPISPENIDSIFSFVDYLRDDENGKFELYRDDELRSHLAFLLNNPNPHSGAALVNDDSVVDRILPTDLNEERKRSSMIDMIMKLEMYAKIVKKLYGKTTFETLLKEEMKEEIGAMQNDFDRGVLSQKLNAVDLIVAEDKSLSVHIDKFIKVQESRVNRGLIGKGELGQVVLRIKHYHKWLENKGIDDVGTLMEVQHANAYFDFLSERMAKKEIGPSYLKKLFATFRTFSIYLVGEAVLPSDPAWMSRRDDRYKTKVVYGSPEPIPLDHLRHLYQAASPDMQLFMLLALNCGCGQAEAGRLEQGEYKAMERRIMHKRIKTMRYTNTPEVSYRLWSRTVDLLNRHLELQNGFPKIKVYENFLLVNDKGKPFWQEWYDYKGHHKYDAISPMFEDLIEAVQKEDAGFPKYTFYQLRKTSATAIGNHKEFRHLDWVWLGHAPKTTAGIHYVKLDSDTLDEPLAWLEGHLFGDGID